MRLYGQVKMGFFPAPDAAIDLILKHIKMPELKPELVCVLDPCSGEGVAIKRLSEGLQVAPDRVYCVELDKSRIEATKANLPQAKALHASYLGSQITQYSFGLIYCNPPFDDELGGGRREELSFAMRATWQLVPRGLLCFVIPISTLQTRSMVDYLDANFENIRVFKFPDEHRKFNEIAVFGIRRKVNLTQDSIRSLGELSRQGWQWSYGSAKQVSTLGEPCMFMNGYGEQLKVDDSVYVYGIHHGHAPHTFKKIQMTDVEREQAVLSSPLGTLLQHYVIQPPKRPPLPLGKGHVALLLAAGMLDGVISTESGCHVVRGTSVKEEYVSGRKLLENNEGDVVGEKVVHSQRIMMTIRAVDESGNIKTFTDSPASVEEETEAGDQAEEVEISVVTGGNGKPKAIEGPIYDAKAEQAKRMYAADLRDEQKEKARKEIPVTKEGARSWKVGVYGVGESTMSFNGLRFAMHGDADRWGDDLLMRWTGASSYEVVASDEEPNK